MGINIYAFKNNAYHLKCYYCKIASADSKLIFEKKLSTRFMAKKESGLMSSQEDIGSGLVYVNKTITISTMDDLQEMINDVNMGANYLIFIENFNKYYRVRSVQFNPYEENSQYLNYTKQHGVSTFELIEKLLNSYGN